VRRRARPHTNPTCDFRLHGPLRGGSGKRDQPFANARLQSPVRYRVRCLAGRMRVNFAGFFPSAPQRTGPAFSLTFEQPAPRAWNPKEVLRNVTTTLLFPSASEGCLRLTKRGSDGVFHAPQNLEKGGHGVSPCTMHHLKIFSPELESVLFRTLFLGCRVPDEFSCGDNEKITNLCGD